MASPATRPHQPLREQFAHSASDIAAHLSPWWRFRVWARLTGRGAYTHRPELGVSERQISPHGYRMRLRAADWMERYALQSGRYYQDDLIALLEQEVEPGHTFVDIGANLGFVTLTAARLVGPKGSVHSVEANPDLVDRLRETLTRNSIRNVVQHATALGDHNGRVRLEMQDHHGTAHISTDGHGPGVLLSRGDDVLGELAGPVFVKVDVEGAEVLVLRGLPRLLAKPDTKWVIEICREQLARLGATPEMIFEMMSKYGYEPFLPELGPLTKRVQLRPLQAPLTKLIYDAVFLRSPQPMPSDRTTH